MGKKKKTNKTVRNVECTKKEEEEETKSIHNIWWGVTKEERGEGRSGGVSNLEQTVHEQREEVFPWGRV